MDIIVTEVKIMASNDLIEMQGKVVGVNRNIFTVECIPNPEKPENTVMVQAGLSGKLRTNFIKILEGDKVTVQVSPYDITKGRITYRTK